MMTLYFITIFAFIFVCFILCSVIMMQESKSGGLGSSFGGGGNDPTDSAFGTATAEVLKKFTGYLSAVFLGLCILLSLWTSSMGRAQSGPSPLEIESIES